MKRPLFILLVFAVCFIACKKTNDVVAQVRAQAIIDNNIIDQYLTEKGLTATTIDTTGVRYIIDTPGTGTALYTSSTSVIIGYTGILLTTGSVFVQTGNIHPAYVIGQVIRGWQLGLSVPKVKQGGTVTLFVPSRQAYGPYPQSDYNLPANAVLIFKITVYSITN